MHVLSWICYGVYVVARQGEDVVFRLWLPLLAPILLIPPLLAALHWAASLVPLYSSRYGLNLCSAQIDCLELKVFVQTRPS